MIGMARQQKMKEIRKSKECYKRLRSAGDVLPSPGRNHTAAGATSHPVSESGYPGNQSDPRTLADGSEGTSFHGNSANVDWVISNTSTLHFCGRAKPWKEHYHYRFGTLYKHYSKMEKRFYTKK